MAILSSGGGGEAHKVAGVDRSCHLFEAARREVMTFIHDHLSVVGHEFIHLAPASQALKQSDIYQAAWLALAPAYLADAFWLQPEEVRKPGHPLHKELLAVDEHERVYSPRSDERGGDYRFAEGRSSGEYPSVMGKQSCGRFVLFGAKLALEARGNGPTGKALVGEIQADAEFSQQLFKLGKTTARKGNVLGEILSAPDDASMAKHRQMQSLGPVEFRVLKGRQTDDAVAKGGR
jgi:hypothetical protein